ncbi:hypothetical protein kuro4_00650 [Gelria sp. Kuro-4]|nr:hypothetical protein kuro4_00650 [Gelria sp. Kuro-4]
MASLVTGVYASCIVCRKWVGTGIAVDQFNVVCLDCANSIADALPKPEASKDDDSKEAEEAEHVFTCSECGETFTSRGKFLAHCRAHKRGAV